MKINYKDGIILLILVTFGAIVLAFGATWFGWRDLIVGNITVFIFSLTIMYFTFSYDKWGKDKENNNKRKGILKGIFKEIVERARYLQHYQNISGQYDSPYFVRVPAFPDSAWKSAISNGYYDPQDQSWTDYSYIYNATDNIYINLNASADIAFKSTLAPTVRDEHLSSIYQLVQRQISEAMIIINENAQKLESELSISHDEILRINQEITNRINTVLGNE